MAAARMLKSGARQSDVAREFQVSRQSVSRWARRLEAAGGALTKLKAATLGRPSRLDAEQIATLARTLRGGAIRAGFPTESWTLTRVRVLIEREFNQEYSNTGVWKVLRNLGFTPQKPESSAQNKGDAPLPTWTRTKTTVNAGTRAQGSKRGGRR